jgi:saccharopine dehydrogenase-like NADP-dependent oxidoreductase
VGVATEYLKNTIVLRDYNKTTLPSLSERATIIINGITYEEDLTSGGAADLPDALTGKVGILDYKTLRFPGHYNWIQKQINTKDDTVTAIQKLQRKMEVAIPHVEDDQIILYAAVEGKDIEGVLRRREIAKTIIPQKVGNQKLRAIQTTTAASLAQAAQLLLETPHSGVLLQSQIDPKLFLNGIYVSRVYGKTAAK